MNRRDSVFALIAFSVMPVIAEAQATKKVWRVGFLSTGSSSGPIADATRKDLLTSLAKLGYQEGNNLVMEWRWDDTSGNNLLALAKNLVSVGVDLIVARTNAPIQAAMTATQTIPIVMLNGNFPVEVGFVKSLARPGANVTGTSFLHSPEIFERQVQVLKEVAPRVRRLAVLWTSENIKSRLGEIRRGGLERAAKHFEMSIQFFLVTRAEELDAVLSSIAASGSDSIWVQGDLIYRDRYDRIAAFLIKNGLASVGTTAQFADSGGLVHYAPDWPDFFDRTASFVNRVLKGANPANLAVEQPIRYNMVINGKTAKALGIEISQQVLLQATRVIE